MQTQYEQDQQTSVTSFDAIVIGAGVGGMSGVGGVGGCVRCARVCVVPSGSDSCSEGLELALEDEAILSASHRIDCTDGLAASLED